MALKGSQNRHAGPPRGLGRRRSRGAGKRDVALIVVAVLTAGAVLAPAAFWLFARDDRVPTSGPSMRPTLEGSEPLEIDFDAYDRSPPVLGQIVALQGPARLRTHGCVEGRLGSPCPTPAPSFGGPFLIKRVVAGPGDAIAIARDGHAIVDGRRLAEPYVRPCRPVDRCSLPRPISIPSDHFFVLGDNRRNSTDSRVWGPVPLDALEGEVALPE